MKFSSKKAKVLVAVIAGLIVLDLLVFGLGTYTSLQLADPNNKEGPYSKIEYTFRSWNDECREPSEFVYLPHVYSGVKRDILYLTQPFNCGWDSGELSFINNAITVLLAPLIIVDLPLSSIADTVMLPKTIPEQKKRGNIVDPPYFRMGDVQRWKGNMDKAIEYYEMGLKVLPKYYGDKSYFEINPFISQLDDLLETLAQDNERKGEYNKAIFYYENLIKIDWPRRVEGHYKTLAKIFLKLGNKDRAEECYKKANEYSQKYRK